VNYGTHGTERILSRSSVERMTTDQLKNARPDIVVSPRLVTCRSPAANVHLRSHTRFRV